MSSHRIDKNIKQYITHNMSLINNNTNLLKIKEYCVFKLPFAANFVNANQNRIVKNYYTDFQDISCDIICIFKNPPTNKTLRQNY